MLLISGVYTVYVQAVFHTNHLISNRISWLTTEILCSVVELESLKYRPSESSSTII